MSSGPLLVDRFQLGDLLGRGAVSEVYAATDTATDRDVAVKLAPVGAEHTRRTRDEAEALAVVASPHVVELVTAGETPERRPFLVLERLRGQTLQERLHSRGAATPAEVGRWMAQAARALGLAHGLGIVHRDLKPANLFLHEPDVGEPIIKVLDFGMRVDVEGPRERLHDAFGGTPLFMAPEQVRGQLSRIGPTTDVWALAMVAITLLTGEPYWTASGVTEVMAEIERTPTTAPSLRWPWLGATFDRWFARATARVPDRRFQSCDELTRALDAALATVAAISPMRSRTLAALGDATTVTPRQVTAPPAAASGPLVGREVELAELEARLRPGTQVTLTGPAGAGKSALAQAACAALGERFPDGAWLVPLRDGESLPAAIRTALHLPYDPAIGELRGLVSQLAPRSALLVLDGAEQVPTTPSALADLRAACPHVAWLVTSRLPLGLPDERCVGVGPLELPRGAVTVEEAQTFSAIELFTRRARDADPGFHFDAAALGDVLAICRLLEGFPHAIELAAAQLGRKRAAEVLTELEGRHAHDVQAAVAWSYGLLAPAEQALLRHLALFPAGLPIAALSGLVERDPATVTAAVERVVQSRLAYRDVGSEAAPRLRLPGSVRDLCRRLSATLGEDPLLWRVAHRHARALVERAEHDEAWLDEIDREHDNLRAVVVHLLAHDAEAALALTGGLTWYWYLRGHYAEGFAALEAAITRAPPRDDVALVRALHGAGRLSLLRCRYQQAEERLARARALAARLGDRRGEADAVQLLGSVARERGDCHAAQALHREGLALWQALGDAREAARARNYITFAAWLGCVPLTDVVDIVEAEDPEVRIWSMLNLGAVLHHAGADPEARDTLRRAFAEAVTARFNEGIAWALELLGRGALGRGELLQAHAQLSAALRVHRGLSDLWRCASVLEALAQVALAEGQAERAAQILGGAEELREIIAAPVPTCERPALAALEAQLAPFAEARARGRGWPLDRVVRLARER